MTNYHLLKLNNKNPISKIHNLINQHQDKKNKKKQKKFKKPSQIQKKLKII